jgi:hypothetical protein
MINGLVILIEGPDDERFVNGVVNPLLKGIYDWVRPWTYAGRTLVKTSQHLASLRSMGCAYVFLRDLDFWECFTACRLWLVERYVNLEPDRIVIVRPEIEAWYVAGVRAGTLIRGKPFVPRVEADEMTKEHLVRMMDRRFASRSDLLGELMTHYDPELARSRSSSFDYLLRKCGC